MLNWFLSYKTSWSLYVHLELNFRDRKRPRGSERKSEGGYRDMLSNCFAHCGHKTFLLFPLRTITQRFHVTWVPSLSEFTHFCLSSLKDELTFLATWEVSLLWPTSSLKAIPLFIKVILGSYRSSYPWSGKALESSVYMWTRNTAILSAGQTP